MTEASDIVGRDDPFNLWRFTSAQEHVYDQALKELQVGRKGTHWMWFIFPQIVGLGSTSRAKHYAIESKEEARHYLNHSVLGPRLLECAEAVRAVEGRSALEIFGDIDTLKLRSSMTLFTTVAPPDSVFAQLLDKYFHGAMDDRTLAILEQLAKK